MNLCKLPLDDHVNKFVITPDASYFTPCLNKENTPTLADVVGGIFELDNSETSQEFEKRLSEGRISLGHFDPSTEEIDVRVPLEIDDCVDDRLKEVFGV